MSYHTKLRYVGWGNTVSVRLDCQFEKGEKKTEPHDIFVCSFPLHCRYACVSSVLVPPKLFSLGCHLVVVDCGVKIWRWNRWLENSMVRELAEEKDMVFITYQTSYALTVKESRYLYTPSNDGRDCASP